MGQEEVLTPLPGKAKKKGIFFFEKPLSDFGSHIIVIAFRYYCQITTIGKSLHLIAE